MDEATKRSRDKSIVDIYFATAREMRRRGLRPETGRLISIVAESEAPRFYVDYESARRVISLMDRGIEARTKNANKKRMYRDLYKLFLERRASSGMPGYLALLPTLSGPAPSFYLSTSTMRTIIYRGIKKGL